MLVGCTNEKFAEESFDKDMNSEYNDLLLSHLILSNNRYELTMSKDDALSEGIPMMVYNSFIESMQKVNLSIEEAEAKGSELWLFDPQAEYEPPVEIVKTRAENDKSVNYGTVTIGAGSTTSSIAFTTETDRLRISGKGTVPLWSVSITGNSLNVLLSGFLSTTDAETKQVPVGSSMSLKIYKTSHIDSVVSVTFTGV